MPLLTRPCGKPSSSLTDVQNASGDNKVQQVVSHVKAYPESPPVQLEVAKGTLTGHIVLAEAVIEVLCLWSMCPI